MNSLSETMPSDFDTASFRRALGHFATGVAVITARGAGDDIVGMTMSSFNSVSLDPPLVLFSVARNALSLDAMTQAKSFGVNVLGEHQQELSNKFAKARGDKWANVDHRLGRHDAPLLGGALAHFECAPYAQYDGGDHVIFLVRALDFSVEEKAGPLIFFRGHYHQLAVPDPVCA